MPTVVEVIPAALAGERVDRVVSLITGLSRADAASVVAEGAVAVEGKVIRSKSHRVALDEELTVTWTPVGAGPELVADPNVPFVVVHEDADVLIVDKPPGLVVHPGAGNDEGTLVHGLLHRYPELRGVGAPDRPGIVHRLDKETSGLLAVARTEDAYEGLVAALARHDVDRVYEALVWGTFDVPSGSIEAPIGRSGRDATRMTVTERGKHAVTGYRVRASFVEPVPLTLVECQLETGRTHQIRVHMEAIGHPVVGDDRYRGRRASFEVPRLCLHAERLAFDHPTTGKRVEASAPRPADLEAVIARLES